MALQDRSTICRLVHFGGQVNFFFGNSGSTIDHSSFVILLEYILAYSKVSIFGDN